MYFTCLILLISRETVHATLFAIISYTFGWLGQGIRRLCAPTFSCENRNRIVSTRSTARYQFDTSTMMLRLLASQHCN
ncbi:hypothetical protein BD769DRAFT_1438158 [Suillus cothurnatus]|nr:hypothetical protein BD769DRAFT_1438158 [Suillus cothurnatus]